MATDAVWYKRAVERYLIDPESFVFSVPFNSGEYLNGMETYFNRF